METKEIKRSGPVDLTLTVPGSKSYSNRALAIAALAEGSSTLSNILESDDTVFMMRALQKLGVTLRHDPAKRSVTIEGAGGSFPAFTGEIYIQNAGTAMRFLTSMLTLGNGTYLLSGNARMLERPIGDLTNALARMGVSIKTRDNNYPPVVIQSNGFPGGAVSIKGTTSSQYISSLLISSPYAQTPMQLQIEGNLVSIPYVDMTIDIMNAFGAVVTNDEYRSFTVSNTDRYRGRDYMVEPDASNASYFFAMPAVVGGRVRVEGISYHESKQGDVKFVDVLESMGVTVERGTDYIEVRHEPGVPLTGVTVDMERMPDVAQTLAVVALQANSPTTVTGVHNMRVKETDRIEAVANELRRMGAGVDTEEGGFTVFPQEQYNGAEIATYDDHRMAMSFALAGLFIDDVTIAEPSCVKKTFPNYFEVFDTLYTLKNS